MAATATATDIGLLTTFSRKTGPSAYTPLIELISLGDMEFTRDSVEFTHHGSPDGYREFKPGLTDAGEYPIGYNLIPGLVDDLVVATHFALRTVEEWRVTFPNGATFDFKGFATSHMRATPLEDRMTGGATFKISGKPVLTPAA